jgi:hypothetical protein
MVWAAASMLVHVLFDNQPLLVFLMGALFFSRTLHQRINIGGM